MDADGFQALFEKYGFEGTAMTALRTKRTRMRKRMRVVYWLRRRRRRS